MFYPFEELRLSKAHHVICMTVRKKINRRFEVLTIEAINWNPRKFWYWMANTDVIIEGKRRYEQWVIKMRIEDLFL